MSDIFTKLDKKTKRKDGNSKSKKISEEYDDEPFLDLEFTDGTSARIIAEYGGYTGKSEDEYPRFILVKELAGSQLTQEGDEK